MSFTARLKLEEADRQWGAEDRRKEPSEEGPKRLLTGQALQEGKRKDCSSEASNDNAVLREQNVREESRPIPPPVVCACRDNQRTVRTQRTGSPLILRGFWNPYRNPAVNSFGEKRRGENGSGPRRRGRSQQLRRAKRAEPGVFQSQPPNGERVAAASWRREGDWDRTFFFNRVASCQRFCLPNRIPIGCLRTRQSPFFFPQSAPHSSSRRLRQCKTRPQSRP